MAWLLILVADPRLRSAGLTDCPVARREFFRLVESPLYVDSSSMSPAQERCTAEEVDRFDHTKLYIIESNLRLGLQLLSPRLQRT